MAFQPYALIAGLAGKPVEEPPQRTSVDGRADTGSHRKSREITRNLPYRGVSCGQKALGSLTLRLAGLTFGKNPAGGGSW